MLPLVGVPMIECVFEWLGRHGVTDAVLSLGYLPEQFIEAYPNNVIAGVRVDYAVEPEPLDTAGAIRFAATEFGFDETFLVVNGDVLTDLNITTLMAFHRAHGGEATIALHPVDDPSRFGVVPTTPEGRVIAFVEKPPRDEAPTNHINAGTYIFEPSVLDRIAREGRVERRARHVPRPRRGRRALRDGRRRLLARHRHAPGLPAGERRHLERPSGHARVHRHRELFVASRRRARSTRRATLTNSVVDRDCVVGPT